MKQVEKEKRTRDMTMTAVMAALIFVFTWLIKFPVPGTEGGYINFGDLVIYMCAYILGGPLTALAAAIGSSLADLAVGANIYVLPTLIIKAAMGYVCGVITKKHGFGRYLLGCLAGGAVMVCGYGLFEYFFFDSAYALAALPFNVIQLAAGVSVAVIFYRATDNISKYYESKLME